MYVNSYAGLVFFPSSVNPVEIPVFIIWQLWLSDLNQLWLPIIVVSVIILEYGERTVVSLLCDI